ncbi:putative extracellular lipase [Talaromyces proteolyticus]|uniref:Carboxylic ester hydrolase n=1 Tax=Talaromyces proteolyticus TaxID=1131652 RepID=A0AAD4KD18_9EURO|nr:putative extracellular lipase [Talaromyces proteolyticus]KAH8688764.1 putative extracellular lipase [Talaromyces proteolyticus]
MSIRSIMMSSSPSNTAPSTDGRGAIGTSDVHAAETPTVTIASPAATVVGKSNGTIDTFNGIPFAHPPTDTDRFKPPRPIETSLGLIMATNAPTSCPNFIANIKGGFPADILGIIVNNPLIQNVTNMGEDCLTINVIRPAGIDISAKLPVVFWIYGGAFELGSNGMYNGTDIVQYSTDSEKPVVFVAANYRVAGFGFLGGEEILADGASNVGLLDQRLALQWVADNIERFGGDPSKVTIFGESAGSMSVLDQMVLYDGDNIYNGKPLFRGAIMDSGSIYPTLPVDSEPAQEIYDAVVASAGCSSAVNTLSCLRSLDYSTMLNALCSVPSFLSYYDIALSYLPRQDGKILTDATDNLVRQGKITKVPFIVGDQQDEGTLFAIFTSNISNTDDVIDYFTSIYYRNATSEIVSGLVGLYPDNPSAGAPYNTGIWNNWYPEFKRMAAIIGDILFIHQRRLFLQETSRLNPDVPSWSFLSSYDENTPIVGTTHGTDVLKLFFQSPLDESAKTILDYYLSFVYNLDPNVGSNRPNWPQWSTSGNMLTFLPSGTGILADDFRSESYEYLVKNADSLRV